MWCCGLILLHQIQRSWNIKLILFLVVQQMLYLFSELPKGNIHLISFFNIEEVSRVVRYGVICLKMASLFNCLIKKILVQQLEKTTYKWILQDSMIAFFGTDMFLWTWYYSLEYFDHDKEIRSMTYLLSINEFSRSTTHIIYCETLRVPGFKS